MYNNDFQIIVNLYKSNKLRQLKIILPKGHDQKFNHDLWRWLQINQINVFARIGIYSHIVDIVNTNK